MDKFKLNYVSDEIIRKYLKKPDISGEAYKRWRNRNNIYFKEAVEQEYKDREDWRSKYTYKDFFKFRQSERPPEFSYEIWKRMVEDKHKEAIGLARERLIMKNLNRRI